MSEHTFNIASAAPTYKFARTSCWYYWL